MQLTKETTDKSVADALLDLAAKSLEQASELERQAAQRRQIQSSN
jgi:hypothetical protein